MRKVLSIFLVTLVPLVALAAAPRSAVLDVQDCDAGYPSSVRK